MFASYLVVLATAAMSAYAQVVTSSMTLTAYQTLSKCDPTDPGKWLADVERRLGAPDEEGMLCLRLGLLSTALRISTHGHPSCGPRYFAIKANLSLKNAPCTPRQPLRAR